MKCPNGHENLISETIEKQVKFREVNVSIPIDRYRCGTCSAAFSTVKQTDKVQRAISDAYRKKVGLLSGEEIVEKRKQLKWSQTDLARRMNVGIASIKRWETGAIQNKSMDQALRMAFGNEVSGDSCSGNRSISLARIKLVLKEFERVLGQKLLVKTDRMLYSAKYLWYADMLAFREGGQGLTGATYAVLPKGPQLNNYKELINEIIKAKESEAELLTDEEKRIITRVAKKFPHKYLVYKAVHNESIVKNAAIAAIIPYTDSDRLSQI
jgi:putative zinc finger/helix-turn-helix YgiT family protein